VSGRVSAILELGTGFHEDRSGWENILLGGMCLGMTREEVERRKDWIVEFSGLAEFMDQPFRTYSSGMRARLTFAVAISVDPDILIIDEALAAGDQFFVTKCIQRIEEICASGATVFFVSHSLAMVERFCSEALYMDRGRIVQSGPAHEVCKAYELSTLRRDRTAMQARLADVPAESVGTGEIQIRDMKIRDDKGRIAEVLEVGMPYSIEIALESGISCEDVAVSLQFVAEDGRTVLSTTNAAFLDHHGREKQCSIPIRAGTNHVRLELPHLLVGAGHYFVTVGVSPGIRTNSYADFYDLRWKSWAVAIQRRGLSQNVVFEQPCRWIAGR